MRITYHLPHTEELYDIALGIVIARKSIPKSEKPIRTTRNRAKAFALRIPIGTILALVCFLMAHTFEPPEQTAYTLLRVCGAIALLVASVDALFALSFHITFRTNFTAFQANDAQGESLLTVDETGVCDADPNGNLSKFAWSNYQSTVITKEVIVLLRQDSIFHVLPYTEELGSGLTEALSAQGKVNTIYRRTIKR